MSDETSADAQAEAVKSPVKLSAGALEALTHGILEDTVYNIIHSIALSCHRSEKTLRMQSAATQAESLALSALESQSKGAASQSGPPVATTDAATYEGGRVYLKGNPLKTTPDITCAHCKLPRLMHPIKGKGMQVPTLNQEYCMLYPWVQHPGHDVFGNPFPTDMAKSKKERELLRQQQKNAEKDSVGTPGSQDTDMAGGDGGGTQNKEIKLNTGGKPATYIPWHTCPHCKRSLLITRFAQHLEKCLGISGRQSSRNAMAKLAGQNGNGTGSNTPLGSRMGTPAPGLGNGKDKDKRLSPVKKLQNDDDDGGEDNETPEKKKKKKSSYIKKADREKMAKEAGAGHLKVKLNAGARKDSDASKKGGEANEKGEGKREREDGGDEVPRKKLKLNLSKDGNDPK